MTVPDHIHVIPFRSKFAEATMYVEVTPDEGGTEYISKAAHRAEVEAAVVRALEAAAFAALRAVTQDPHATAELVLMSAASEIRAIASDPEAMRYFMEGDE
jgi:hypothetical protein